MASKSLVSLVFMTLVIVTQLAQTYSLSTHSDDPAEHSPNTMPKKPESSYLYVLGRRGFVSRSSFTSRLSTATGEWKSMKDLPEDLEYFCGAVVEKKIHLFGGSSYKQMDSREPELPAHNVYDCLTDTYTQLQPIPFADSGRRYCGAAVLEKSIYVAGGSINHTEVSNGLFRFDTQTNQWSTLSPMNDTHVNLQLIELNGLLYAVDGGFGMEIYNATTDTWSRSLAKSHYRPYSDGTYTAHEGKIYSFNWLGFEVYSPDTDQWTILTPPFPGRKIDEMKLVSMNGKLWTVGGFFMCTPQEPGKGCSTDVSKAEAIENLYSYEPSTDKWTEEQKLDDKHYFHSAFVVNF